MDEAMHPLTILTFGMYGSVLPNQNGAPVRVTVPWKYGFKSGKSIVKIRFTEKQPITSWGRAGPTEYGFYSNVNPDVDHPRWSQATERRIGEDGFLQRKRKTLLFNGYAEQVGPVVCGHGPAQALLSGLAWDAIGWLKPALFVLSLVPFLRLFVLGFQDAPGRQPDRVHHPFDRFLDADVPLHHLDGDAIAAPDRLAAADPAAPHAGAVRLLLRHVPTS